MYDMHSKYTFIHMSCMTFKHFWTPPVAMGALSNWLICLCLNAALTLDISIFYIQRLSYTLFLVSSRKEIVSRNNECL